VRNNVAKSMMMRTGPKSLNINVRKAENDRIERENHSFAQRLFLNASSVPAALSLEREFVTK
jgi:hypothetical protein